MINNEPYLLLKILFFLVVFIIAILLVISIIRGNDKTFWLNKLEKLLWDWMLGKEHSKDK